jgi:predicted transcriptional regulator
LLARDTQQRSHIYSPTLAPDEVQTTVLDHVLKTAFRGDRSRLVLQALGGRPTSPEELKAIKELLDKIENE